MRRLIRNYILSKVVSFFLVGTCMGQALKVVEFAHAIAPGGGLLHPRIYPSEMRQPRGSEGHEVPWRSRPLQGRACPVC